MGRYYYTDNGKEGKFMFGVQPSDDPDYMGMIEQEPTSIDYYADKDNVETSQRKNGSIIAKTKKSRLILKTEYCTIGYSLQ